MITLSPCQLVYIISPLSDPSAKWKEDCSLPFKNKCKLLVNYNAAHVNSYTWPHYNLRTEYVLELPITTKWVGSRKCKNMSYAYHWTEQNPSFNLVPKLFISYNIWQRYCRKSVYDFMNSRHEFRKKWGLNEVVVTAFLTKVDFL